MTQPPQYGSQRFAPTTKVLTTTVATIVGTVVFGGVFGAVWVPGVGLTALVALIALFVILFQGADAMNEPSTFGQGLTAVLAAIILLPAAIVASVAIGATFGVADAFDEDSNSSYDECLIDPDTTFDDCAELQ